MSVSSETSRYAYAGNGATTVFSFPQPFLLESDLVVISVNDTTGVETLKTLTTHYTITGEGTQTGSVTMLTAPATGTTLVIYRDPPFTQELELGENDPLPVDEIEKSFDKLTELAQRLSDQASRSVRLPEGFSDAIDMKLPGLVPAGYIIAVNSAGTALEMLNPADIVSSGTGTLADGDYGDATVSASGTVITCDTLVGDSGSGGSRGFVPAPAAGDAAASKFLKADGTWAAVAGGGGGGVQWIESGASALPEIENSMQVYKYVSGDTQDLYCVIRVPSSYVAANPIKMLLAWYSPDSSGTGLISSQSTLIRSGTDAVSSTTNQRTSTNTAVTLAAGTVNEPQAVILDISSTIGQINSVSIAAGDFIKIRIFRGTDTSTSDIRVLALASEVTFA